MSLNVLFHILGQTLANPPLDNYRIHPPVHQGGITRFGDYFVGRKYE